MNYTDFREKIIIKGVDKKVGEQNRVSLQMYYEPHIGLGHWDGWIGEKSFPVDKIKGFDDSLNAYKEVWTKLEPWIEQYYFMKIVGR